MFKEFLLGVLILFIVYLVLRFFYKKNIHKNTYSSFIFGLLGVFILFMLTYNMFNIYPDTYLDTYTGVYRYGTFSENLFAYSKEFRYRDEILFPILRNRTVELDSNGSFYKRFFSMFSEDLSENLSVPEVKRKRILSDTSSFDYQTDFNCIGLMDYATDSIPEELRDSFDEKKFPGLYINTSSLKNNSYLVAMVDSDYTVYLMGKSYYELIDAK